MPRNSSGVYALPASNVNPPVALTTIDPVAFANEEQDIAAEITNSLDRLGRSGMLANLPMGGFKINNLGAAVGATDAARLADVQGYLPAGSITLYGASTPPVGWLECDGSAVSRTGQAALFAAIGTTWGVGDGSTTFNLPDIRGVWPRGWDHGKGIDPARAFGSFQDADILSHTHVQNPHTHPITDPGHTHPAGNGLSNQTQGGPSGFAVSSGTSGGNTTGITINPVTAVNQSYGGTETRVKNYAMLFIIRT